MGAASGRAIRASLVAIVLLNFHDRAYLGPQPAPSIQGMTWQSSPTKIIRSGSTQNRALTVAVSIASAIIVVALVGTAVLYPRITAPSGNRTATGRAGPRTGREDEKQSCCAVRKSAAVKGVDAPPRRTP